MSDKYNLTNEEAINAIEKNMPSVGTYTVLTEALYMAIKALKKDIATIPTCEWPDDPTNWQCPTCQSRIYSTEDKCPDCGQKFDWDSEEKQVEDTPLVELHQLFSPKINWHPLPENKTTEIWDETVSDILWDTEKSWEKLNAFNTAITALYELGGEDERLYEVLNSASYEIAAYERLRDTIPMPLVEIADTLEVMRNLIFGGAINWKRAAKILKNTQSQKKESKEDE